MANMLSSFLFSLFCCTAIARSFLAGQSHFLPYVVEYWTDTKKNQVPKNLSLQLFKLKMKKSSFTKYMLATIFTLLGNAAWSAQNLAVCVNSKGIAEEAECLSKEIDLKVAKFQKYFLAAQKQESLSGRSAEKLIEAQQTWEKYLRQHCDYLYSREQGSARFRDSAECQLRLYDERINEIWISYLTFFGSAEPVLPDPKK